MRQDTSWRLQSCRRCFMRRQRDCMRPLGVDACVGLLFLALTLPTIALPYFGHDFQGILLIRIIQATGCGSSTGHRIACGGYLVSPQRQRHSNRHTTNGRLISIATGFVIAPALYKRNRRMADSNGLAGCHLPAGGSCDVDRCNDAQASRSRLRRRYLRKEPFGKEIFNAATRQPATWVGVFICFCLMWILNAYNDLTPLTWPLSRPWDLDSDRWLRVR